MTHNAASAIDAILTDLLQPEMCTCGHAAPDAWAMEGHLSATHGLNGTAYPAEG